MLKNNFLFGYFLLLIALNSCTITKRRYAAGWHVEWKRSAKSDDTHTPNVSLKEESQSTTIVSSSNDLAAQVDEPKADSLTENQPNKAALEHLFTADVSMENDHLVSGSTNPELSEQEKTSTSTSDDEEEKEPKEPTGFNRFLLKIATAGFAIIGYGMSIGAGAIILLLADLSFNIGILDIALAFVLSSLLASLITFIILNSWIKKRPDESRKERKKRIWKYSFITGMCIALFFITIISLSILI